MTVRTFILSGLLLCGSAASGKDELSFKETVVPVKVAPAQDSITAAFPFTNTSGVPSPSAKSASPATAPPPESGTTS